MTTITLYIDSAATGLNTGLTRTDAWTNFASSWTYIMANYPDLVTADVEIEVQCYGVIDTYDYIQSVTTDSTHRVYYIGNNGAVLNFVNSLRGLRLYQSGVVFRNIEFYANLTLGSGFFQPSGGYAVCENCILNSSPLYTNSTGGANCYNCVYLNISVINASFDCINCYSNNDILPIGASYCASDGGTNGLDVPYDTTTFVSVTEGSEDLNPVSGSLLRAAGIGPALNSSVPTLDYNGNVRDGNDCDIGIAEYVGGGGGLSIPVAMNHYRSMR